MSERNNNILHKFKTMISKLFNPIKKLFEPLKRNEKFQVLAQLMKNNIRHYGMFMALIIIMIFFYIMTNSVSIRPLNINNIILQNAHIIVLAVGMLFVIVTGNIDLSVGSVAAFVGAMSAIIMRNMNVPWQAATILGLMIGIAAGMWNGFWIAYIRIPAFIVTLGGMLIFRGLTLIVLGGQTIGPLSGGFNRISSGFIPDIFANNPTGLHLLTVFAGLLASIFVVYSSFRKRHSKLKYKFEVLPMWVNILINILVIIGINALTLRLAQHRGLPNVSIILFVIIIIYTFISKKTKIGRHVYAVGGNRNAAELSGVNTKKTLFLAYTNMGFLAAVSGLIYAARLNAATPKAGDLFELDAIGSVFIGGASMSGGIGTVGGAVIGALVMGVINNGMSLLGLGIDWQQVVKGLVLLMAVWFDIATKNKR